MNIKNVSFIGLGVMGYPMAGHLQKNGYNVTVYNRTETKSQKWVSEFGGQMVTTSAEASKEAFRTMHASDRAKLITFLKSL